jgi:hypothetical protein
LLLRIGLKGIIKDAKKESLQQSPQLSRTPCRVIQGDVIPKYMGCVQAWSAHGDLWWKNLDLTLAARVGREIERHKREREEEMRKEQGGQDKSS